MSDLSIVIVTVIKLYDDATCRKTPGVVRSLEPAGFFIVAPFSVVEENVRLALAGNQSIIVVPDSAHGLISVISKNAYYSQRRRQNDASNLVTLLTNFVEQSVGSSTEIHRFGGGDVDSRLDELQLRQADADR